MKNTSSRDRHGDLRSRCCFPCFGDLVGDGAERSKTMDHHVPWSAMNHHPIRALTKQRHRTRKSSSVGGRPAPHECISSTRLSRLCTEYGPTATAMGKSPLQKPTCCPLEPLDGQAERPDAPPGAVLFQLRADEIVLQTQQNRLESVGTAMETGWIALKSRTNLKKHRSTFAARELSHPSCRLHSAPPALSLGPFRGLSVC